MTDPPTGLPAPGSERRLLHSGKVRDLYDYGDDRLLMVASDRISAYDYVLTPTIPDKGEILTRLSLWWFDQLRQLVPHHVVTAEVPADVAGRAIVCEKLDMFPIECVARGYLAGSGLTDYARTGAVCGVDLPPGLLEGSRLAEPIFTPATKADLGDHDENIGFEAVVETVGREVAEQLRTLTLAVYGWAEPVARERGIVLADTKFEFGRRQDGTIVLADEVLTPDSSRFWPAVAWRPGQPQPAYDKQLVRDWLTSPAAGWDRTSGAPPPPLPDAIVGQTRSTYVEAFERLTGQTF